MRRILIILFALWASNMPAAAFLKIEEVTAPKTGVKAWLVEDHTLPIVTAKLAWRGGTALDPAGSSGLTALLASLMNEGAADLDSAQFQEELANIGMQFYFDADLDSMEGDWRYLKADQEKAEELVRQALSAPRFDDEAINRMKAELQAVAAYKAQSPGEQARMAWFAGAYPDHGYGRPKYGMIQEIEQIKRSDIHNHFAKLVARDNVYIAVVGAINAKELAAMLDRIFAQTPPHSSLKPLEPRRPALGVTEQMSWDGPQTEVIFGLEGVDTNDPDFFAAYLMTYILGGGSFSSRFMDEIREKRGLTYSVYSYLENLDAGPLWLGSFASKNETAKEALTLLREEIMKFRADGPTEAELNAAKTYLIGSYPLRFDSALSISDLMVFVQWHGLSPEYFTQRATLISAVTKADIMRVANQILQADQMRIQIVGQPNPSILP